MLGLSEVKTGAKIELDQEPYEVVFREHSKIGRQGAVLRTKLRNLKTGNVIPRTFQGNDSLKEAELSTTKAQYLYREEDSFYFMDQKTFEQFSLNRDQLGKVADFLKEETNVDVLNFKEEPVNIEMPVKVNLEVIEAPPAVRGNTADGGNKQVKLETGYTINVPLFIKQGDTIKVNTAEGRYVERVS